MTIGTLAVVVILTLIVGTIFYRWYKARKAGVHPSCGGCSGGCHKGGHAAGQNGDSSCCGHHN